MNHCDKLFPAIYGNLDSETGFDTETVTITTISNRTDYVKLSNRNGNSAYMICDFTQWENLPRNSKRDHCKLYFFYFFQYQKTSQWGQNLSKSHFSFLVFGHFWQQNYENTKILRNLCLHFGRQDGQDGKKSCK